ncbi:DUF3383 domain-containing protein [Salinarimonas soli]|uniref:DUF3383 domain-containing protein n=1 Tax=Salinarimonas soli TaxID=1638099 RepID=A0A5B2VH47_9HYPH|nr:DUF3383 domain-containing protein [Salinarimonas soli]KAA2237672.1 DUF3383 domain-containing protein [Salinarimonas soli]
MNGLPVSDVVKVDIALQPLAAPARNFGAAVILGDSEVIDPVERIRQYAGLDGVANDFGLTTPEYKAAELFFSQEPQPSLLYIARRARNGSKAVLHGGVLTTAQRSLAVFTAITTGSLVITVDGVAKNLANLNFSGVTNLNGVASIVTTALAGAICTWDAIRGRFDIVSPTTGAASTLTYATGTAAVAMCLVTGVASAPVAGVAAESQVGAIQILADRSREWYAVINAVAGVTNVEHLAAAAYVEGSPQSRLYGVTISTTDVLDPTRDDDLASQLKAARYKRTWTQYSSSSPVAIASFFGRAATVNFEAQNTTITLKFKQEPGVVAETLTVSQAATLKAKNCNVFVNYENGTAILQEGVMANGYFFDEVHGTDWLQNAIQTDVYNLLYQAPTKVPQTDAGTNLIVTTVEATMARAVNNGLVAPGVWNSALEFGTLRRGQALTKGFYIYAPLVALQPQADREARKAVPIQVAAKLAGAVHSSGILVNVNR